MILDRVCQFYKDGFDQELLHTNLYQYLLYTELLSFINIVDLMNYFLFHSLAQLSLFSNVKHVFELILVMLATETFSERSLSALKKVKTY